MTWGEFDETAPCGLCFTSGTTGAPKGVTYTHRSSYLHTLRMLQADVMAISARDTRAHRGAHVPCQCVGPAVRGARRGREAGIAGPQDSTARSLAALINSEAVTVGVGIATVWLDLVEHLESSGGEVPTLERVIVGGAPLPPALMESIEKTPGRHGADQLGHDRAVAVGHGLGA